MAITKVRDSPGVYSGLSTDTRPRMDDAPTWVSAGVRPGERLYLEDQGRTLWASANRQVKSVAIDDGGRGYAVSDALTFAPAGATGTVATVNAEGAILTVTLTARGAYARPPTVTAAETTGSGARLRAVLTDGWRYMDPAPSGQTVGAVVDT